MPPKRTYRRKTKKTVKVYRKRSYRKRIGKGPVASIMTRKLIYCDQFTLTPTINSYVAATFRCNSLYSPSNISGGHQPYGHDELMGLYSYNRVIASTISVRYLPKVVSDYVPGYVAIIQSGYSAHPTFDSLDHFLEVCYTQGTDPQIVGGYQSNFMPGQRLNWIKGPRYSMKKLDKASFKDTGNWGTTGAPPGIVTQYWHVVYYSISGNTPSPADFEVKIEFTGQFFDRELQLQS